MFNYLKSIKNLQLQMVLGITIGFSVIAILYFFDLGLLVSFNDSATRLDISRKLFDNLTPGLGQLGNVWPPLPAILMLPFVLNKFLWTSAIAGSIVSGLSFILLVYFTYKIMELLTTHILARLAAVFVLILNINILYMQTTAMSEVIFITFMTISMYFLLKWAKYSSISSLMAGGAAAAGLTLIRYEGYLFTLGSIFIVFLISLIKTRSVKKSEGTIIMYSTLAITGMVAWAIYLWFIFGDPFYWLGIYSHKASIISTDEFSRRTIEGAKTIIPEKGNILRSVSTYWKSVAYMNGILTTIIATIGTCSLVVYLLLKKRFLDNSYLLVLLLPLTIFIFLALSLFTGSIPIFQPSFSIQSFFDSNLSLKNEFNIRYGLLMAPFIAICLGWLSSKQRLLSIIVLGVVLLQSASIFSKYSLIYQLPNRLIAYGGGITEEQSKSVKWMKDNYDGGLIMISALQHDPVMFRLGIDYKNYIHEGTQKYWLESRKNPTTYARWIYMYKPGDNTSTDEDSVTKYLADKDVLKNQYALVYQNKKIEIFKRK